MSWRFILWFTCAGSVSATLVLVAVAFGRGARDFFPVWVPVVCLSFYVFSILYVGFADIVVSIDILGVYATLTGGEVHEDSEESLQTFAPGNV